MLFLRLPPQIQTQQVEGHLGILLFSKLSESNAAVFKAQFAKH